MQRQLSTGSGQMQSDDWSRARGLILPHSLGCETPTPWLVVGGLAGGVTFEKAQREYDLNG